jgi:hypothetical protein
MLIGAALRVVGEGFHASLRAAAGLRMRLCR